ncbi:DNA replication licensing factor [Venturia nashicola]|uniref:DNA replication licensing factor n=1 Tax=Venturia nashicola TaxID=86259 RepID=A0A4Z1NZB0_9PEZI|nr:DNA replication licensing factor [Venturia nashicola]
MESKFMDPLMAPLEWGWDIRTLNLKDATKILSDYRVDKMLEFLHVSTELKFWTQQLVSHEREWHAEDGRTGPAIKVPPPSRGGARYKTLFNGLNGDTSDATIILLEMYAPVPEIDALQNLGFLPKGKINAPDLQKTSDLVFLTYYLVGATEMGWPDVELAGGSKIPPPRHIIIPFIDNNDVVYILETVFRKTEGLWDTATNSPVVKTVPGVRFDASSQAGMAILGTKHGAAVGFLLLQHKREFGVQVVREVRVWHEVEGGDLKWYLYFGIGGVEERDGVRAKL